MQQEPTTPTTCDHCGKAFNTSAVHPRRYCSIACEEGRAPLPDTDPASPGFCNHVQGSPEALVGCNLIANGLKRTCYSPDWHRNPADYNVRTIVSHDEANEVLVVKDDVYLGKVYDYENGVYAVEKEDMETGKMRYFHVDASLVLHQLRRDNWWAE